MPTWIHTEAAAAVTGWLDQMVPPTLTRCWTQRGELCAVGCDDLGRQAAWHLRLGLQDAVEQPQQPEADPQHPAAPRARPRARRVPRRPGLSQFLEAPHSSHSSRNSAAAMSPWCSSADRNAASRVGSAGSQPGVHARHGPGPFTVTPD